MWVYKSLKEENLYKTIELDKDLLEIIENGVSDLYFKGPSKDEDGEAVLCSDDATFSIKRKNHSNTVLLGRASFKGTPTLTTFTSLNSDFECKRVKGTIKTNNLPSYDGKTSPYEFEPESYCERISYEMLKENSPVSDQEFEDLFYGINGSEVNDFACVLTDSFVTECLDAIIGAGQDLATSQGKDPEEDLAYKELDISEVVNRLDDLKYCYSVIKTVLERFSGSKKGLKFSLDSQKVAVWYGIEALKKHAGRPINAQEFLIKWKGMFPHFYSVPIELKWLVGYFARPLSDKIQYLSKESLSRDPKKRFKQLFEVQSSWEIEDIEPYINDLNSKNMKIDKFVMKYARKVVNKKKVIVSSR